MNSRIYFQLLYLRSSAVLGWTFSKCPAERKAVNVGRHYFMTHTCAIFSIVCLLCCADIHNHKLVKTGDTSFRITLNYPDKELTNSEIDSIEHTLPSHIYENNPNKLYTLLDKKGFISNSCLDTSNMMLSLVSWENPIIKIGDLQLLLDTTGGYDRIITKVNDSVVTADLGPRITGDIFVTYNDIDSDNKSDLLVMKKYYIMGGYNFEIKLFQFK